MERKKQHGLFLMHNVTLDRAASRLAKLEIDAERADALSFLRLYDVWLGR